MSKSYFPTGIVTGSAFCNREKEREYLKRRAEQNAHVVLISPRRYGKSSLIAQFTLDQKMPTASVDLLPATSGKYVKNAIMDGVMHLLNHLTLSSSKALKQTLMQTLAQMNPVIELSAFGQKIKLNPEEKTPEETIMKLLMGLDEVAATLKKQLIFVIDEFQQIATLEEAHSLEASIRHAVERSQYVFYVFSGSNRTLLEEMFKNKSRPLYHLCDEIKLHRIAREYYEPFILEAAQNRWQQEISLESIEQILILTERHPYYLNRLCRMLWDEGGPPSAEQVEIMWAAYVESQKTDWVSEVIRQLSVNQRVVLSALAKWPEPEIGGKEFSQKLSMATSSIQRTISTLLKKDFIYKDPDTKFYEVLNPVMKTVLARDKYFE